MDKKPSGVVKIVEKIYVLVKTSLYFWLNLLRQFVFYGFIDSQRKLFAVIDQKDLAYEKISYLIQNITPPSFIDKIISLMFFFGTISLGSGYYLLEKNPSIGLFFCVVGGLLLGFLLNFSVHFLLDEKREDFSEMEWLYFSLKKSLEFSIIHLYILSLSFTAILILFLSPIIFGFLMPGFYSWLIKTGYTKFLETKGESHDYCSSQEKRISFKK